MGDLDGIGEVVTGGLLAASVEPRAGAPDDARAGSCLNCGAHLVGPYCASCGQKAQVHRSLRGFGSDLVQGLFNFEGKIWRTVPMLAWCPGDLTRRYIDGERARFVSPVALYLFTVFLTFAVLSFTGALSSGNVNLKLPIQEERAALVKLEAARATALRRGGDVVRLDRSIQRKKADIAQAEAIQTGAIIKADEGDEIPAWLSGVVTGVQRDPKGSMTKIQDATSKFSWLLIPLSLPFMWLLFPFSRRFRMYDHVVFVTYSLSFMMLLVILGGVLVWAELPSLASMLFLIPPVHMYRQLRGAYQLNRVSAVLRTVALVSFAFVAATFFAMTIVAIGLL